MTPPANIDPKGIQAHLATYKGEQYVEGWASLWEKGDDLPWDRGFPNPALEDTLVERVGTVGGPVAQREDGTSYRRKALVPGCGRGVDVLLLASFGYDAYGLEYSPGAVEACKKEEAANLSRYPVRDESVGRGKVTWIQGDFFDDAWLKAINVPRNGFDIVYDYTFFCALSPEMRPKWALRHTELLASSPAGNLICLEFPRHKDPLAPGPPYASPSEAYVEHLSHPGEKIVYNDKGVVKADPLREPSQVGLERVAHWQPARTHTVGQGENGVIHDRVSIWRRRD
ncbi:Thiopurine S-methyltransferase family protein [Penicillium ucsense]|uniref:Thiopurine S-methyltransferase family protein n=1 Tax=Penicillium ucsense TaxID=2839758 RepID=A0A8J8W469_9EURO|nr:Thiopurine S-methyltransferase family protein [Penicillium ucsense]KAF7736403.1 Thiopurine S-methyltransferase family protein [Penicillium ucsense]